MASIRKRVNKSGISYQITVTSGTDINGKKKRHFMEWSPEPGMTEKKIEKAVRNVADDFEKKILKGYSPDDRQTFAEYAEYVLGVKEVKGRKNKTLESYRYLLKRINTEFGHMRLNEITSRRINSFYRKLATGEYARETDCKASLKNVDSFRTILQERKLSHIALAKLAGTAQQTIDSVCKGNNVSFETAIKISTALELKVERLFVIKKDTRPLSAKTILEYHRCIHTILDKAYKEKLVETNEADAADPPEQKKKEVNYFQPSQVSAILTALDGESIKWKTIIHLLIVTGCRRGEIAALKWKNIDLSKGKIKIDSTLLYSPSKGVYENATKTGDIRYIRIPAKTVSLLREYLKWYFELRSANGDRWQETGYCFVRDNGLPIIPDSITSFCRDFSAKHPELPHINPHAFRHTFASTLINNGKDVVTVSKSLGHSRTSTTTDVYAHVIEEAAADVSECIAEVLLRRA